MVMSQSFDQWYEELKKEAPSYGFGDKTLETIGKTPWKIYFNRGTSPSGALCEWSFESTGIV